MSKNKNIPFFIHLEWVLHYLSAKSLIIEFTGSDHVVEYTINEALLFLDNNLREGNSKNDYKQFVSDFEYFCSQIGDVHKHILKHNNENKFNGTDVLLINDIYNILLLLKQEILSNPDAVISDTYFNDGLLLKSPYNLYNLNKYVYKIHIEKINK